MFRRITDLIRNINYAIKIAVIYVFFGCLWIVFSDSIVDFFINDLSFLTKVQTIKGWFFVFASGLIIYFLISRAFAEISKARTSLKQALLFHKTLFEEFPQPVYQLSSEGKIVFMNSKCRKQPGLNKKHVFDNEWLKYVHHDDKHIVIEKYRKALSSEMPYSIEYRLLHKDGAFRWLMDNGSPFFTSTGQLKGYIGSFVDIEEKKTFELKLEETLKMYSDLFNNNPAPMFVFDIDTLKILEVNESAIFKYGYGREEFLELSMKDICCNKSVKDDADNGKNEKEVFDLEDCTKHITKNGNQIDVELDMRPLPDFKDKRGCIVAVQDVTERNIAFNDLSESEKRFKTLFKSSPDVNIVLTDKLIASDINEAGLKFFNKNIQNLTGISLYNLFEDYFTDIFVEMIEDVDDYGFCQKILSSRLYKNKEFSAEIFCLSFFEHGNKRYYLSLRDITEKVLLTNALVESERMLNTLIDNVPGMVYRCKNEPHYLMEFVSEGCLKITGYKPNQIENSLEVSFGALIHPDDRKRIWEEIQENLNSMTTFVLIYRIITANGDEKWVVDQAKGVFNEKDDLLFIEGFISDITEEKNMQDALAYQSNLLKSIIDNIPFPVFYKSINGKYLGCNYEFLRYLGKTEDEIIGKTVFDIFPKEQAEEFDNRDKQLYDSMSTQKYETTIHFKDGQLMDALFFKSVFFSNEGKPDGIVGVYLDISDRVQAEKTIKGQMKELERINAELERFTYTVSHDLRSPLVTIKGFLNMIRENAVEGNIKQLDSDITRISKATDKMHFLLEDLLQLSRIGRVTEDFKSFSMLKLVNDTIALLKGIIDKNKAVVQVQKDMHEAFGDRHRIGEVWQNLIENSLKFKGGKKPFIKIGSFNDKDNNPVFFIEDNGIGVEKHFHKKVFGLFDKLNQDSEGTGVGLAIVSRIIDIHGGRVWCESEGMGKGCRILFTLAEKN